MKDTGRPPAKVVRDVLKYRHGGTVLDVGAGFGRHSFFLAEQGFEVTAAEPDPAMYALLEDANEHTDNPIHLSRSSLDELNNSNLYDIVVATMLVHFMPNKHEAHQAIKKLQSLTNPGGLNCVSVLLKKEANNLKPYLFEDNELSECYSGWNILHYDEDLGLPYQPSGEGAEIRSYAARIIAEKPSS